MFSCNSLGYFSATFAFEIYMAWFFMSTRHTAQRLNCGVGCEILTAQLYKLATLAGLTLKIVL